MSLILRFLNAIRKGDISSSYLSIMVCIEELGDKASVHDISLKLEQPLPILRTNLCRMCDAGWCKKVGINQYQGTPKWSKFSKSIWGDNK